MTKKELENTLLQVLVKLEKLETEKTEKTEKTEMTKKPLRLLRFPFSNWELRRIMKINRVKWNPIYKGWEFDGKIDLKNDLKSQEFEVFEVF